MSNHGSGLPSQADHPELEDQPARAGSGAHDLILVRENDRLRKQLYQTQQRADIAEWRLQATLESITDAFYSLDRLWRFTYLNREAERLLERNREEVIGKVVWDEFPYAIGTTLEREYRRAVQEQRTVQFEEYFPAIERWIEVHAYPSTEGLAVYFSDVTAQHHAAEALRASEARYRALFNSGLNAVLLLDASGRIASANAAASAMLGHDAHAFRQMSPFQILDTSDPRIFIALQERYRVGHFRGTLTLYRSNGSTFPAEIATKTFSDEEGEVWHSLIIRDISEETRTTRIERFLAESGRALAAVLDFGELVQVLAHCVIPELADFAVVDIRGSAGEYQRVAVAHRDPELEERLRQTPCICTPSKTPPAIREAVENGTPQLTHNADSAILVSTPDDPECLRILERLSPRSIMILPLRARGQTLGALTLVSSRTGHDYDRIDLTTAETLSNSAALAIANARLYQESKQATLLRDEVLAVVSHDLRNPLHTIGLSAELLTELLPQENRGTEAAQRQIEIILRSTDRANRLIQDLLDVATIQAGGIKLQRSPTPSAALIDEVLTLHSGLAREHGIELILESPGELPPIYADHGRMLQVFSNLIGNAIKFTPAGGLIRVSAARSGNQVRFAISDTGSGIRPEDLKRLFDPFWQAAEGAKGGVGLGLPIARGIVEAHGGQIWVESELGSGTTFYFTVPTAPYPAPGVH